jgi:Large polyvalent protein associated domain 23
MPIGTDDGEQYENGLEAKVSRVRPVYITKDESDTPGIGSGVEDRREMNPLQSMAQGVSVESLTQKMHDLMNYGLSMSGPERGAAINADENKVPENQLGNELGSTSIGRPLGGPTEPAGALKPQGGSGIPGKGTMLKPGDKTPEGETVRIATNNPKIYFTDEDIERGMNVGMSAGAGTIAGIRARTMNPSLLKQAQAMEYGIDPISGLKTNASAEEIWQATGWHRGPDNRWKFEIPDQESKLKIENLNSNLKPGEDLANAKYAVPEKNLLKALPENPTDQELEDFIGSHLKGLTLKDILHHPELHKAYPHLKNIKIVPTSILEDIEGTKGWFDSMTNTIGLGPGSASQIHSTLMHEIQHAIQHNEGFSFGGSPSMFKSDTWQSLETEFRYFKDTVYSKLSEHLGHNDPRKFFDYIEAVNRAHVLEKPYTDWVSTGLSQRQYDKYSEYLAEVKKSGFYDDFKKIVKGNDLINAHSNLRFEHYKKIRGESESRNVQRRLGNTEKTNKYLSPEITTDTPYNEQIWSPTDPEWLKDLPKY